MRVSIAAIHLANRSLTTPLLGLMYVGDKLSVQTPCGPTGPHFATYPRHTPSSHQELTSRELETNKGTIRVLRRRVISIKKHPGYILGLAKQLSSTPRLKATRQPAPGYPGYSRDPRDPPTLRSRVSGMPLAG